MHFIKILEPRWHDGVVLVAKYKVRPDEDTYIKLEKSKATRGKYRIKHEDIASSPVEQMKTRRGGTIDVIAVPLDKLEKVGELEDGE